MELVDTHCHLQFAKYDNPAAVVETARAAGVTRLICVGTSLGDSQKAIDLAGEFSQVWPTVGCHPHEAEAFLDEAGAINKFKQLLNKSSIVAVGEIGLDYYKNYSPPVDQQWALRQQIEAALDLNLPFIFHVRDAWKDFWSIYDSYPNLRGVVHSFSAHQEQLDQILQSGLCVGLSGIMTFTTDNQQLEAAKKVPLSKLLLETDAPFLTPKPHRGQTCEPKHVVDVAKFLAELRGESLADLAAATTENAITLFKLAKND